MKRFAPAVAIATLAGCGGGGGYPPPANPLVGTWSGPWVSVASADYGTTQITFKVNGTFTGTTYDAKLKATGTLAGTAGVTNVNSGQLSGNLQFPSGPAITVSGSFSYTPSALNGSETRTSLNGATSDTFTLNKAN